VDPRVLDPATSLRQAAIAVADAAILEVGFNSPLHASEF
jgi:hypothetical protein